MCIGFVTLFRKSPLQRDIEVRVGGATFIFRFSLGHFKTGVGAAFGRFVLAVKSHGVEFMKCSSEHREISEVSKQGSNTAF